MGELSERFVYEEKEPILEPIDYASTAYELATPGVVSSLFPYAMFKGTEAAVTGTHNYLMENDENYRQLNNSVDSSDPKTKVKGINMLAQMFGLNPRFGFEIPVECQNVPSELLQPRNTWESGEEYDKTANKLVSMFNENFIRYSTGVSDEVNAASPKSE